MASGARPCSRPISSVQRLHGLADEAAALAADAIEIAECLGLRQRPTTAGVKSLILLLAVAGIPREGIAIAAAVADAAAAATNHRGRCKNSAQAARALRQKLRTAGLAGAAGQPGAVLRARNGIRIFSRLFSAKRGATDFALLHKVARTIKALAAFDAALDFGRVLDLAREGVAAGFADAFESRLASVAHALAGAIQALDLDIAAIFDATSTEAIAPISRPRGRVGRPPPPLRRMGAPFEADARSWAIGPCSIADALACGQLRPERARPGIEAAFAEAREAGDRSRPISPPSTASGTRADRSLQAA